MNYLFKTAFILHLFLQVSYADSIRLHGSAGLLAVKSEQLALLHGAHFLDESFNIEEHTAELMAETATEICMARGYGGGVDPESFFEVYSENEKKLLFEEIASEHVIEFSNERSEQQGKLVGVEASYSLSHPMYSRRRICNYLTNQCIDLAPSVIIFVAGGLIIRTILGVASRGHALHLPFSTIEVGYLASSVPFLPLYAAMRYRRYRNEKNTGEYNGSSIWENRVLTQLPTPPHLAFSRDFKCFETGWKDCMVKKGQNTPAEHEEKNDDVLIKL